MSVQQAIVQQQGGATRYLSPYAAVQDCREGVGSACPENHSKGRISLATLRATH